MAKLIQPLCFHQVHLTALMWHGFAWLIWYGFLIPPCLPMPPYPQDPAPC